jgi:hypothetical protein
MRTKVTVTRVVSCFEDNTRYVIRILSPVARDRTNPTTFPHEATRHITAPSVEAAVSGYVLTVAVTRIPHTWGD